MPIITHSNVIHTDLMLDTLYSTKNLLSRQMNKTAYMPHATLPRIRDINNLNWPTYNKQVCLSGVNY